MQKALSELERSGLVTAIRTSGRVVTENREMIMETRNSIAKTQIQEFLQRMMELGYEKKDILTLLKKETGGEDL
jgi:DNA-binding transcriptional regulator YhcF (GntR family)